MISPRRAVCLAGLVAVLAVCVSSVPISSSETRSVVRVKVSNADVLAAIGDSMVWTEGGMHIGQDVDIVATPSVLARLQAMNAPVEMMIEDMDALIAAQQLEFDMRGNAADYNTNYHTYEEIKLRVQELVNTHPNTDYIPSIGKTVEGRDVIALRIGAAPTSSSDQVSTLWFQCGQHAREWISAATCLYVIQKLLEGQDTTYKSLLSNVQIYWVPMVNPDGFTYSQSRDRLWRKNRKLNKDGTYGVDLNRNWGNHWGEGGASTIPSSETYRGLGPFSEPETTNIVNFIQSITANGTLIEAGIDFHSYSQLILRPYGWAGPQTAVPDNDPFVKQLAADMRDTIRSVHGSVFVSEHSAELYIASGGAADWLAGNATAQKNGLTLELRDTGRYGFLLPANQIIPSGEEILPSVVLFAESVLTQANLRRAQQH